MKLTRDEHLYFNACAKALLACPDVQSMSAFTQHGVSPVWSTASPSPITAIGSAAACACGWTGKA